MKYISKLLSGLTILLLLGTMTASAIVQNRDVNATTDGNMEKSGTTAYSSINSATISKQPNTWNVTGNQVLRAVNNAVTNKAFTFNPIVNVVEGERWRVRGRVKPSSATLRPVVYRLGSATQTLFTGGLTTDVQDFDFVFTATASGYVAFYCTEVVLSSDYCEWDDMVMTRHYGTVQNRDTNLVADGDMEAIGVSEWFSSITGYTKEQGAGNTTGSQVLRLVRNAGSSVVNKQGLVIVGGATYRVSGQARGNGTNNPAVILGAQSLDSAPFIGTPSTSWQFFDVVYTPDSSGSLFLYAGANPSNWVEFDNISVTRHYGTVQNRETQLLVDGNMEAVGTSAWNNINVATSKIQSGEARGQYMRVERTGATAQTQQAVVVIGKTYRIRGEFKKNTGNPVIYNLSTLLATTTSTDWTPFDVVFTATATTIGLYGGVATGQQADYDNISITQVY